MSINLLKANIEETPNQNVCISPFSLQMAMGMVNNGACNETQKQIMEAMDWGNASTKDVNKKAMSLSKTFTDDDKITIDIANSIWVNANCDKLKKAFVKANEKYYDAEVQRVPFDGNALQDINQWCAEKTHQRIDKILSDINASAQIYLLNALYFKGTWQSKFMVQATQKDFFHAFDGDVEVPMMRQQCHFNYAETNEMQMVEMPFRYTNYKHQFVMYVILPKQGITPNQLLAKMTPQVWNSWTQLSKDEDVRLRLPKFKLEYETIMNKSLQHMGIHDAFEASSADFSKICKSPLFIDQVIQKTFLEVSEEGAEAAAVTAIAMTRSARPFPHEIKNMIVDRPFLFVIGEKNNNNILFLGKIEKP